MPGRLKARAQKRRDPGEMTLTEKRYRDTLELRRLAGEIDSYSFEPETFTLAKDLRYTPDFRVVESDGTVVFIEVKPAGYKKIPNQANSRTKIHVAAELHPYVFMRAVKRQKKAGGGFDHETIEPR